ncbi:DUF1016 N-terminal domain-containing protein [Streptomyces sp. NPDC050428]|uniref:DUF1016 N-terminal domain-containing protein n=1 Tax=Streptomyces sp. NPDC050428 TaxID=3155757 RepID=UPI0034434745
MSENSCERQPRVHARRATGVFWLRPGCQYPSTGGLRRTRTGTGRLAKVIDRISTELRTEFPNQRGFSRSNVKYMRQMARTWPEPIVQQAGRRSGRPPVPPR